VTTSSTTVLTELAIRVGPVLIFLVAITVVAEIADSAGVFDIAGHWAARAGHGRAWLLWLLVVGLSCLSTIFLSLDTTAVLLTPVVIAVARQLRLNPLPFAMTTVWLTNTASLLLPVSNLTNLCSRYTGSRRWESATRDTSGWPCGRAWQPSQPPWPCWLSSIWATCEGTTSPRLPRQPTTGRCSSSRSAQPSSAASPQPSPPRSPLSS